MTFGSSVLLLIAVVAVIAVIALLAYACIAPRRKSRVARKKGSLDPLSDPPTITHYGHA